MKKLLTKTPHVFVELAAGPKACRDKLQGILHYAQLNGPWELQLLLEGNPDVTPPESFKNWRPDGRIISLQDWKPFVREVKGKTPVVTLDIPGMICAYASSVNHDSEKIAQSVADYYLQQRFEHFAFIGSETGPYWSSLRAQAFEKVVRSSGYTCSTYSLNPNQKRGDWILEEKQMRQWLLGLPKPCGIMAAFDLKARQVLECCLKCDIKVPDEVAVIGVDNDEAICENTTPPLSSVLPDFEGGGYMAAELLDRQMRSTRRKPVALTYGIKRIVHRQSSLHTSNPNRLALKAKEFIRLNACMDISVDDVARHLNVSRRLADLRFHEACGYSLLTEIQNRRLERVCALLRETRLPIGTIGERCGYTVETYLKVLFKKRFGKTMREYRDA